MGERQPVLWWVRRDMRLDDNPCLQAALAHGAPIIPVVILDPETERLGRAPLWRWGLGVARFDQALRAMGGRLVLRRGVALTCLRDLARETRAVHIHWSRAYDPDSIARDTEVKAALKADGLHPQSHAGHLLHEPWQVTTRTGGFYKVYTPMWKALRQAPVPAPVAGPVRWPAPESWPISQSLEGWHLAKPMHRAAPIVARYQNVGEQNALQRLSAFCAGAIKDYKNDRDLPGQDGTSRMSAHLSLGEIGARRCWHAGLAAMAQGHAGAETFLKEVMWREFAYHLMHHTPHILSQPWRPEWRAFPWSMELTPQVRAWQQGRTGVELVDAAMRELWVSGHMHNRARMIAASYLTKHLMADWRIGQAWFADCLCDWDPASNALGWQWVAGCGPDAAPFFRVFNPETQAEKFDSDRRYRRAWIAEGQGVPPETALDYFNAIPGNWGLKPDAPYPRPVVDLAEGRKRALEHFMAMKDRAAT